jgi:hypothetical protein
MHPNRLLTAEQWSEFFDEEIEMRFVDFRGVQPVKMIGPHSSGTSACHRIIFFSRSPPDLIEDSFVR